MQRTSRCLCNSELALLYVCGLICDMRKQNRTGRRVGRTVQCKVMFQDDV